MTTGRRPLRLLAITGATSWGGAEIVLGHLLAALGPHVQPVLLGVDPEVTRRVAAYRPGIRTGLVPAARTRRDLAALRAQRQAIAAQRADVVQVNLPVPAAEQYTVLAAVTVPGVRVVVVEHLPMPIASAAGRALKRATSRRLAAHLAVGAGTAREVETLCGLPAGSIRAVPNGVPEVAADFAEGTPDDADTVPGSPGWRDGRGPVVGAVGRLHRQKGLDVLVRAVSGLPGVRLVLVGDGPERAALERLADGLGMADRLTVTGWTDEPHHHLAALDVVALPSRFEGLPLVLLEAMHAGLAVVATPVGSVGDALVDGVGGLVVPVDDVEALRVALARLLADPALRRELGARARAAARSGFTAAAMAAAYEQVYEDVLAEPARTGLR